MKGLAFTSRQIVRMSDKETAAINAQIDTFIRERGVTKLPPAAVAETTATFSEKDLQTVSDYHTAQSEAYQKEVDARGRRLRRSSRLKRRREEMSSCG